MAFLHGCSLIPLLYVAGLIALVTCAVGPFSLYVSRKFYIGCICTGLFASLLFHPTFQFQSKAEVCRALPSSEFLSRCCYHPGNRAVHSHIGSSLTVTQPCIQTCSLFLLSTLVTSLAPISAVLIYIKKTSTLSLLIAFILISSIFLMNFSIQLSHPDLSHCFY